MREYVYHPSHSLPICKKLPDRQGSELYFPEEGGIHHCLYSLEDIYLTVVLNLVSTIDFVLEGFESVSIENKKMISTMRT